MTQKARRGFAAMSPEKQKEIASLGGKAAHAKGTAHQFTSEEAKKAGALGGKAAHANRLSVPELVEQIENGGDDGRE